MARPLAHAHHTVSAGGFKRCGSRALAVVTHGDMDVVLGRADVDGDLAGPGVAAGQMQGCGQVCRVGVHKF